MAMLLEIIMFSVPIVWTGTNILATVLCGLELPSALENYSESEPEKPTNPQLELVLELLKSKDDWSIGLHNLSHPVGVGILYNKQTKTPAIMILNDSGNPKHGTPLTSSEQKKLSQAIDNMLAKIKAKEQDDLTKSLACRVVRMERGETFLDGPRLEDRPRDRPIGVGAPTVIPTLARATRGTDYARAYSSRNFETIEGSGLENNVHFYLGEQITDTNYGRLMAKIAEGARNA